LPATASLVQHGLGAAGGAFDVNSVCSGFVSALATAFALCEQAGGPILAIGADTYSRWLSMRNRSTAVFFGDGAGAVVVAPTRSVSLQSLALASDGAAFDKIIVRAGGSRRPAWRSGVTEEELTIGMDGRAVWQYATAAVPAIVRQAVERAGLEPADIDWLVPHQANQRMLEEIVKSLGLPRERLVSNIAQVANTAAASIPIALDHAVQRGQLSRGDTVALVGFGGGLATAALCLSWAL
jgi:3-oxoacyl-[acyl-carrier-protein] synthase-3